MLRSLSDLRNYALYAIDGKIGSIHDLLFDDKYWTLRYFVVDTGTWLPGRMVLISPVAVGRADWSSQQIRVRLTRDRIREAPAVNADPPVSRQEENRLASFYAWPTYWAMRDPPVIPPQEAAGYREKAHASSNGDPHLRSLREVSGYHIVTRDGVQGHLDDLIGEEGSWGIRYVVVDTRNWLPGKRVLLSPKWIDSVDWSQAQVFVDVTSEQIKDAPAYDPAMPINRAYETRLYDAYGRPTDQ